MRSGGADGGRHAAPPGPGGAPGDPFAFRFLFGGKFISAGKGMHGTRTRPETELVLVASGALGIRVGRRGYDLGPGQFLVMPAGVEHGGTKPYPRDLSFYWLHMMPDPARERNLPASGTATRPDAAFFWCDALLNEQRVPDNERICDRILALLFCEISRAAEPGGAGGAASARNVDLLASAARRRMRMEFRTPGCSTASIARGLGCNPDYLGRVYRAAFGETAMDTIERLRLGHCENLLRTTDMTIAEIARDAGYSDPAYFRRRFAMRHSVPPRAWRQAHSDAGIHVNSV